MSLELEKTAGSRHECRGCASGRCSADAVPDEQLLHGWRLSCSALTFFALPSACAILGAACGRSDPQTELVGALAGLASGLVVGGWLARLFDDRKEAA